MFQRFIIVMILCARLLPAQSLIKLDGFVRDVAGNPLSDVRLELLDGGVVYSDVQGYFFFENLFAGNYVLTADKIGYEKKRKSLSIDKSKRLTVTFVLREKILSGPRISVTASSLAPAGSIVLNARHIRETPAADVGELLRQMPGVRIITDGNGGQYLSVRGSALNQILVLLDGVVLNDPLSGKVDLSPINTAVIESIRLLKGNQSARFGSGALGGVLLINTQKTGHQKTRINVLGGHFGLLSGSIDGGFNSGAFSFEAGGAARVSSGDFPYAYNLADGTPKHARRLNGGFKQLIVHSNLRYESDVNRFAFFVRYQDNRRGLPGQIFSLTPYAKAANRQWIFGASFTRIDKNRFSRFEMQYRSNRTHYQNNPPADAPLKYRTAPPYDSRYQIETFSAAQQMTASFWQKQLIVARLEFRDDDFNDRNELSGFLSGGVAHSRNQNVAFTLQNEWHLPRPSFFTSLQIDHALRLDYFKVDGSDQKIERTRFSPDITFSAGMFKKTPSRIWLRYGNGFRMPSFADLFYQDFRVKGNAGLLPEISHSLETGLENTFHLGGIVKLSAVYFDNRIDNLILWQLGSFSTWRPLNSDARISGWEGTINARFWHDRILINMDETILKPLNKSGQHTTHNKDLTYRPRQVRKVELGFRMAGALVRWQYRREGERFITASNTVKLASYSVQDITINYKTAFFKTDIIFRAALYNLTDTHFEMSEHAPMPGRTLRIGMELRF